MGAGGLGFLGSGLGPGLFGLDGPELVVLGLFLSGQIFTLLLNLLGCNSRVLLLLLRVLLLLLGRYIRSSAEGLGSAEAVFLVYLMVISMLLISLLSSDSNSSDSFSSSSKYSCSNGGQIPGKGAARDLVGESESWRCLCPRQNSLVTWFLETFQNS